MSYLLCKHILPARYARSCSWFNANKMWVAFHQTMAMGININDRITSARCKCTPTSVLSRAPVHAWEHNVSRAVAVPNATLHAETLQNILASAAAASSVGP